MGFGFETWNEIAGPIYMGANTSMEVVWTAISAGLCVAALVAGSKHELDAYKKAEDWTARQSRNKRSRPS
ncbi:MAG: hypothetical protein AAFP68_20000, partial [Pseudomonadota bacterium]